MSNKSKNTQYYTKHNITQINDCCDNPSSYGRGEIQEVINDAKTHYNDHKMSKDHYESVVRQLNKYIK